MVRTLHKLKSETAELKIVGQSSQALLVKDTVRIHNEVAEVSKRIDENLEKAINCATTEHQKRKAELQVLGKLELERLHSCYEDSAAEVTTLDEFEQKYSDLIGSDVNQRKDMASICTDWENYLRATRATDSAFSRSNVRVHFTIGGLDVENIAGCGKIQVEIMTGSPNDGGATHNQQCNVIATNQISPPGVPSGEASTPNKDSSKSSSFGEQWDLDNVQDTSTDNVDTEHWVRWDIDNVTEQWERWEQWGIDNIQATSTDNGSNEVGTGVVNTKDDSIDEGAVANITWPADLRQLTHPSNVIPTPLSYGSLSMPRLIIGSKGNGRCNFDCPSFVSVSSATNKIYISDTENNRIQVGYDGEFLSHFGSHGTSKNKFTLCNDYMAGGVTISKRLSQLLIADSGNDRIKIYNGDFKVMDVFNAEGSRHGQLSNPLGITTDRRGHIYVSEAGNNRIHVFDPSGRSIRVFGTRLDWVPCGIAVCSNGNIVVADRGDDGDDNGQIEIFSNNGQNTRTIEYVGSSRLKSPRDVAVDREGNIIVTDAEAHRVHIIREDGDLIKTLGRHGHGPGQFKYPSGVTCLEDGGLIVVDQGNHRVQIF